MEEKSFLLFGPDDIEIPNGPSGEFIFKKLQNQKDGNILMIDQNTKKNITSGEILQKSIQLADALRNNGVKKGDVISIVSENNLNYFIPVLATLFIGCTINPLNPAYSIGELLHAFDQSRPKIVFCSKSILHVILQLKEAVGFIENVITLEPSCTDVIDLDTFSKSEDCDVANFKVYKTDSTDDIAIILSSSGTTGLHKGVMITYNSLRYHIAYTQSDRYIGVKSDYIIALGLIPVFHIFGLFIHLTGITRAMKSVILEKLKPETYLKAIEENKVTKLFILPSLATFLANSPLVDNFDMTTVREIHCGGAPLSQETAKLLKARLKARLRQIYGLTEMGAATVVGYRHPEKLNTVGVIVPKLLAKVCDIETRKSLPPNATGELCFKGPTVMKGYINDRESTEVMFDEEGFLRTGDIGYYDTDGYFYVVDRLKNLIKCKGFQVPPAELEAILLKHPSVADVAVIGIPDERAGELPMAVVVKAPSKDVTKQELMDLIAGQVSTQKRLYGGVKFTNQLPKNSGGKILRRKLREMYNKL